MAGGRNSFTIKADTSGLKGYLAGLGEEAGKAIRPAAQAAAQVLYDDVKANVARIGKKTGNLERSIYQVYSEANSAPLKLATYHVSWNARTAPHAGLVEYGHIQRYVVYKRKDGTFKTKVRPGMKGKKKPGRRASQAEKDAYYVPLATPVQVAARPFIRPAVDKFGAAMEAARAELLRRILDKA